MKTTFTILVFMMFWSGAAQSIAPREDFLGLIKKEIRNSRCKESGKVTIEITANSAGYVVSAKHLKEEVKVSDCLIEEALHHAKNLLFTPNKGAPELQTTKVIYDIKEN